jgi:hypothetical protein
VLAEPCDGAIGKENGHLKRDVKKLKLEVNKLKKQIKVHPLQDNHSNMVKKLEKKELHQRMLLNNKRSKFITRRIKMSSMQ